MKYFLYPSRKLYELQEYIGRNADGKIWDNDDINAAIASISWGRHWPDTARATAYKTCDRGGYLD